MKISQTASRGWDMDLWVSGILRIGLSLSLTFITCGLVWKWHEVGAIRFDYSLPKTSVLQFVLEELHLLLRGTFRPRLLINLGIAILLLTPYVRVLVSVFYFAMVERNRKYTLFTLFVFLTLTYNLLFR
ncbi:MAG: DUF1634 domain-containing protein [Candidatus Omnitrophica bacterium]|nr:DUF1634 domain-containing protein [Candidatus Omnitrophota bacterium]